MSTTAAPSTALVNWLGTCLGQGEPAPMSCEDLEDLAGHLEEHGFAGETNVSEQLVRPGSVFGDIPRFLRCGESTTARAVEDSVVLSIDSVTLFGLLGRRPMLARRWLVSVAQRMAAMQDRVSDLLAGSLDMQVASWVRREAGTDGVTVSQQTLAHLLGARCTGVNQSLRRLEADGLIETGHRRIAVRDEARLAAAVGHS